PRDETEELLAALWGEVLGLEVVGIHDSFFAAGGHSLQAMQLATRIREALRVDVQLRSLFEAPTVAGLAERLHADGSAARLERVARVSRLVRAMSDAEIRARLEDVGAAPGPTEAARRRELLDHFLRQEGITAPAGTAIVPLDPASPAPLSFSQERLWVLEQLAPGTATYTIPAAIRMRGALDVEALRRALAEIFRRHDALRTVFSTVDGEPVATVSAAALDVPLVDLAGDDALRAFAEDEAARPFDLAAGPLFRATLARLADDDHALILVMHHAVVDGWSLAVLYRELAALYAAFRRGAESPLAPLPVRYADFAAWQRAELGNLERETDWWRGKLAGLPDLLELPADHPRPSAKSYRGAVIPARFPAPLATAVRALARESGATPFMALLAALSALLHRWTGATDFAVGTPTAGRPRPETEGLIGFFVNTLVLRADVTGDPTFRELLGRVREATLGAYAHQDVPFERLVDALRPERSTGHDPFFAVMLALQNAGELRPRLDGLEVERMHVASPGARADLAFSLVEDDDGIGGLVEYSTDLFERASAERMLEQFRILLEAATARPDTPISALPLLAAEERRTIVEEWSGAPSPFPRERIDQIFAGQAAATPDAVALAFDGGSLTYRELDDRATRLTNHLRTVGVVAGTRVGVCLERSPEMIV
ncbi:MAG TPA: condensation domain-containing protein, partial [Longimicrobium sp.]